MDTKGIGEKLGLLRKVRKVSKVTARTLEEESRPNASTI